MSDLPYIPKVVIMEAWNKLRAHQLKERKQEKDLRVELRDGLNSRDFQ
jgi:hypothetical protein